MEQDSIFRELILELLTVFGEYSFNDLVEHIWRRDDLGLDDVPEEQVKSTLEKLDESGYLSWNKEHDTITLSAKSELERTSSRSFNLTLTKWRATIVGSYRLPDSTEIDIFDILKTLKGKEIQIGSLKREFTENREIDFDWRMGGIVCESLWSANRFHIHAYFFEEPFPEIILHLETVLPFMQDNIISMLPSAGALMVYSVMRDILKDKYPQITINIDDLDLRLTGGSFL